MASGPRSRLTAEVLKEHGRAIEAELCAKAAALGAEGFSFVGRPPEVTVELLFGRGTPRPRAKDLWIDLPAPLRGRLKVSVRRRGRKVSSGPLSFGLVDYTTVTEPLAPGARIFVPIRGGMHVGGAAAVVSLDGQLHLLTCAHLFDGYDGTEVVDGGQRDVIATLSRGYLEDESPLDAAVCALTQAGLDRLNESTGAATWLSSCHEPEPGDNGAEVIFFPTSAGNGGPYEADVNAYRASTAILLQTGRLDGLIELEGAVVEGDSGSMLAIDDQYYGICSGQVEGRWSFFTPIAAALVRLTRDYREVRLWQP